MEKDTSTQAEKPTDWCDEPCCTEPMDVFSIAAAISVLLYKKLNSCQLETVTNLLTLVVANLSALITQANINAGIPLQPPV